MQFEIDPEVGSKDSELLLIPKEKRGQTDGANRFRHV